MVGYSQKGWDQLPGHHRQKLVQLSMGQKLAPEMCSMIADIHLVSLLGQISNVAELDTEPLSTPTEVLADTAYISAGEALLRGSDRTGTIG